MMTDILRTLTEGSIAKLRNLIVDQVQENNVSLVDGIYLSWDDDGADVEFKVKSEIDRLLVLEANITGSPQWMSLNFSLGAGTLHSGDTLCFIARAKSDTRRVLPLFVRSMIHDRLLDFEWGESIEVGENESVSMALCKVPFVEGTEEDLYRTIVMKLPQENFRLSLVDLRFFTMPRGSGGIDEPLMLDAKS